MRHSLINNSLLLAVLATSATFCTLTTVLSPAKVQSAPESIATSNSRRSQFLDSERRSSIIRNVGFYIVISVGTGIAVAEASRKWQAARKAAQLKQQTPLLQSLHDRVTELQAEPPTETGFSETDFAQLQRISAEKTLVGAGVATHHDAFSTSSEDDPWFEFAQDTAYVALHPLEVPTTSTASEASTNLDFLQFGDDSHGQAWLENRTPPTTHYQILESPEQYKTCRIQLPHHENRWFGIVVDDRHYRLFRTETIKEKALQVAARLTQRGDNAIVTHIEERYIVWTLEPSATPVG